MKSTERNKKLQEKAKETDSSMALLTSKIAKQEAQIKKYGRTKIFFERLIRCRLEEQLAAKEESEKKMSQSATEVSSMAEVQAKELKELRTKQTEHLETINT